MTDHEKLLKISQVFNHWNNEMTEYGVPEFSPSYVAMFAIGKILGKPWEDIEKAEAVREWKSKMAKPGDRNRKRHR